MNFIIKTFVENQRESTKYLISKKQFPDCWSKLSQEDKNNWNENTKRIKNSTRLLKIILFKIK